MSVPRGGIARRSCALLFGAGLVVAALAGCSASNQSARAVGGSPASTTPAPRVTLAPATPTPTPTTAVGNTKTVAASPRAKPSPTSPECSSNPSGVHHIYVNIAVQHLWACFGGTLFTSTAVTTGAWKLTNVHDATPTGTWRVYGKARNVVLSGHDANGSWHDHVAYWMPFTGPYGFHDASWQTFPYGSSLYATKGSHGCVHVPVAVLGAIYNWAPIGTLVTIVGH
ncbi:MAG TPA: L,D-transpeptidase [Galbitalea sp.]|jgi:lipoprotein-anchoring transpeptidase ErfK/SrfK|nr:L,D-transpeptidase [Galbitalea sp.]